MRQIEKSVWPLNLDFVLDVIRPTWRYYMRDPYTDNNLIDYYTIIFIFVTYYLLDLHFSLHSLPSNDPQSRWAPNLPPAKSALQGQESDGRGPKRREWGGVLGQEAFSPHPHSFIPINPPASSCTIFTICWKIDRVSGGVL